MDRGLPQSSCEYQRSPLVRGRCHQEVDQAMALLHARSREPEMMDNPDLDGAEHVQALLGLSRLNSASFSQRIVWRPIHALAKDLRIDRLRVLDVGSGAGDVLLGLWKMAQRHRLALDLQGVDISGRAVAYARSRCQSAGALIDYTQLDALDAPLPTGADVLISSLFLHHLSEEQAVTLLRKMAVAAKHLVIVNDLRRCAAGLMLAHAACRVLTRSRVVHVDGPRSVRAGFTPAEMLDLLVQAGMVDARVTRCWPYRILCTWRKRS